MKESAAINASPAGMSFVLGHLIEARTRLGQQSISDHITRKLIYKIDLAIAYLMLMSDHKIQPMDLKEYYRR